MLLIPTCLIFIAIPTAFGRKIEKCFRYKHNSISTNGTNFEYCVSFDASDPTKPRVSEFKQMSSHGQKLKSFERGYPCPSYVAADAPIVNGDRKMGFKNKTVAPFSEPQCNDAPLGRLPIITDQAAFDYLLHLSQSNGWVRIWVGLDTYPITGTNCVGNACKTQTKWLNVEPETWFDILSGMQYYINVAKGNDVNMRRDSWPSKLFVSVETTAALVCEYKCV